MRIALLESLCLVMERSQNLVRIFATTRMDPDILLQFEKFPRIELRPEDKEGDINHFVQSKVQSVIDDGQLLHGDVPDDLKAKICGTLRKQSNGMFQLAALHITLLCNMPTQNDVTYSVLPDTLSLAYDQIYDRIAEQKGSTPQLALNAFQWIKCSYEPLNSRALLAASTVKLGGSDEFFHDPTVKANDLLKACQNLLILDEHFDVLRFAHFSADEFLETRLSKVDSYTEKSKFCLSLLCTPTAWNDYDNSVTDPRLYRDRNLLMYATVFWPWPMSRYDDDAEACRILDGLWAAFTSVTNHSRWLQHCRTTVYSNIGYNDADVFWRRVLAVQKQNENFERSAVSGSGLTKKFRSTFEFIPFSLDKTYMSELLRCACGFGDLEIARLLIDLGADVTTTDERRPTPLHCASERGHEETARLLIDRRADVLAADKEGFTPLHRASAREHEAIALLLIDRGAGILATDNSGRMALYDATAAGHRNMARLLVDRGADFTAANHEGRTLLHLSSQKGPAATVRLLIDRGAEVLAADNKGRTALHFAS
ncbi:ankyrin repeat-containing domain protein [Tricharina praecox]|uniref:ankyrin repeat-containing domain protein n=1 Tax=Tricharina praecox TaxID=43433 RepID=UPI002220947E|nr:ankyrin repeat-containing domain protein [Tricharina praecox]KAI5841655.1 ankyrin repeat-containing domain protein [Tricharina praecox]